MNNTDIVTILGNISQSLYPVQHLITGCAYVLGLVFYFVALEKMKKVAGQSNSHESKFSPFMYIVVGTALVYLPSAMNTMANTAFGTGNVLTYPTVQRSNVYSNVGLLVQTGGLLWFIRGCVLIAHASEPSGAEHGIKGLLFLIAGIFALNFDNTIAAINSAMTQLITLTMTLKSSQGY
ncbi:MAG: type IV secretion protein IcmC [Legionellales bacterium]